MPCYLAIGKLFIYYAKSWQQLEIKNASQVCTGRAREATIKDGWIIKLLGPLTAFRGRHVFGVWRFPAARPWPRLSRQVSSRWQSP